MVNEIFWPIQLIGSQNNKKIPSITDTMTMTHISHVALRMAHSWARPETSLWFARQTKRIEHQWFWGLPSNMHEFTRQPLVLGGFPSSTFRCSAVAYIVASIIVPSWLVLYSSIQFFAWSWEPRSQGKMRRGEGVLKRRRLINACFVCFLNLRLLKTILSVLLLG